MSSFTEPEIHEIAEAFLVANTGGSFQRWLERHAAVTRISLEMTADQLLDQIHLNLRAKRTELTVARAYAFFVALILQRRRLGAIGDIPIATDSLRWARAMWESAKQRYSGTSIISTGSVTDSQVQIIRETGKPMLVDAAGNPLL